MQKDEIEKLFKAKGEVRMKNIRPIAFWPPVILFVVACVYNFQSQDGFTRMINGANSWLMKNFAWAFSLGVLIMLAVIIYLMFSKFGDVRIGGREAAPMLDDVRYFSITLTSIVAIGILFWATSEPLYHLTSPPQSLKIQPNSAEAAVFLYQPFCSLGIFTIGNLCCSINHVCIFIL